MLYSGDDSGSSSSNDFGRQSVHNIENKEVLNVLSTNARSVAPKIDCLVDYLEQMDTTVAILSETWLSDSDELHIHITDIYNRCNWAWTKT